VSAPTTTVGQLPDRCHCCPDLTGATAQDWRPSQAAEGIRYIGSASWL